MSEPFEARDELKLRPPTESTTKKRPVGCVVHSARLMFCPQCKAEYRSGFTQCSDCYVDLVGELPEKQSSSEEEQSFSNEALTLLWECADESECVGVCRDLQEADIPYKVDQIPYERVGMRVKWHYRI